MKTEDKNKILIDVSTRAVCTVLGKYYDENPARFTPRSKMMDQFIRRAGYIVEDDDDPIYDTEAIGLPDERFIKKYWKEIGYLAAGKYKKYIIPKSFKGIKLGTLEEYQEVPTNMIIPSWRGLGRSTAKRNRIIVQAGGYSEVTEGKTSLIGPGGMKKKLKMNNQLESNI